MGGAKPKCARHSSKAIVDASMSMLVVLVSILVDWGADADLVAGAYQPPAWAGLLIEATERVRVGVSTGEVTIVWANPGPRRRGRFS
jgi:hypothetical protein